MRRSPLPALALVALLVAACGDDDGGADDGGADTPTTSTTTPTVSAATTAGAAMTTEATMGASGPDAAATAPGSDSSSTDDTTALSAAAATAPDASAAPAGGDELAVVAGEPFPAARCAANEAAGTITYLTGFDFAAAAGMVDVFVAEQAGYYDDLCLDVELQPSFSVDNYPFIASGDAQFASGGSFSEVVNYADANEADLVAVDVEGRVAIDSLILRPGTVTDSLEELAGSTIGVKGAIPPSVAAMLATAGLAEGEDYETVLIDGFDPLVHIELDGIVGFPGYRSNEPGQLERAGVDFDLFVPADYDVPGSFGVIISSRQFLDEHPTAAEDFLRATMRGLADALADPAAASTTAMGMVDANGNPNYLSAEGEAFRWDTESAILRDETPAGTGVGIPDPDLLTAEVEAYAEVGLFGGTPPDISDRYDAGPISSVYDGAEVIWPAT